MDSKRVALIAGGGGVVGSSCLSRLLDDKVFHSVVALVRHRLDIDSPRLTQIMSGPRHPPEIPPMPGGVVFWALGSTIRRAGTKTGFREEEYTYAMRVLSDAHAQGAESVALVSTIGADPDSKQLYFQVKGELERDVQTIGYKQVHIFQPSFLLGRRNERRRGESLGRAIAWALLPVMTGPLKRYQPIRGSDVGEAMVEAVLRGRTGVHIYHREHIERLVQSQFL